MSTLSLSVTTETSPLVFAPFTSRWVSTVTRPSRAWRETRVSSPFVHGSVRTHAALEDASIEAVLYVEAASAAALDAARDEVEAAFSQWSYEVTVTEDGVSKTYECDAANLTWNPYDAGMAARGLAQVTVTIPCYPIPKPAA